jgi:hypothetical protein
MSAETVELFDAETRQTLRYIGEPRPRGRGCAETQTPGCWCPHCSDSDDDRPCLHAGRDLACYCHFCADPDHDGGKCSTRGTQTCGRCGRRDWAQLDVLADPSVCGMCRYKVYKSSEQVDLSGWSA